MSLYRRPKRTAVFNHDDAFQERVRAEGGREREYAGPDVPVAHIRRYASDAATDDPSAFHEGGIKHWALAPWRDKTKPDPRGFQHHDDDGVPISCSRKEIDEVVARTRDHATPLMWERD